MGDQSAFVMMGQKKEAAPFGAANFINFITL